ncbi:MAG: AprI/Inh family metalloprotease inhibitor [Methylocystis sp.]|nr:AprI/Inh family metalloprotease inhibitor [Methylocystis sp.]
MGVSVAAWAAGTAANPAAAAGRYAMLRAGDKDTGCMLTLDDKKHGPGGFKALLAPACRDQGLVIFDPVGWSIERGRLALTARKGHKAHFDLQADGVWRRDAKEGKALALKRL